MPARKLTSGWIGLKALAFAALMIGLVEPAQALYPKKGDSAPHHGVRDARRKVIQGIDVSRWQGEIDWARVKDAGTRFAFIKATEGGDYADPNFRRYWNEAARARIPRGAYHYFYFCRSGAQQAAWFISNVPRERGALPPVIDLEWTVSKTCPRRPPSWEVLREAKIFKDILHRYYGQRPIIYTTVDFYRDNDMRNWPEEFWLRSVAGHPRHVYPGQRYTFWQYTGTGRVSGIGGDVDLNVFAGSPGEWRAWLNGRMQ